MFAEVAFPISNFQSFTYAIPKELKKEQSARITKKTKLGLKMALSRIDSVANEAHTISDPKIRREVVTYMMDLRYKLHELLDDTIHFERVTLKKNLKI